MATMLEAGQEMITGERELFPVARLLGMSLVRIEPGLAVFTMAVDDRYHNPLGTLHGGIYSDLADAAMGWAYGSTLGEGQSFTTIELKVQFLRAVRRDTITAEARLIKGGATLGYIECEVKDGEGRLVAKASSTCLKLTPRP